MLFRSDGRAQTFWDPLAWTDIDSLDHTLCEPCLSGCVLRYSLSLYRLFWNAESILANGSNPVTPPNGFHMTSM